jgi:hypothetical protein
MAIEVNAAGTRRYTANNLTNDVTVFDISTGVATIGQNRALPLTIFGPIVLAVTGTLLYVANEGSDNATRFALSTSVPQNLSYVAYPFSA